MSNVRDAAYQIDPVLWVHEILGVEPTAWQQTFLRAPRGSSILALTARQVGKTTTAAWAIAHTMLFVPGSLSVIACPAQRQSAEAVRRVREALVKAGAELASDNVYGLELQNGSRVLALPGSDDFDPWTDGGRLDRCRRGGTTAARSDRCSTTDAGASPAGALCHDVDSVEPHGSFLAGLGGRRPELDPAQSNRRLRPRAVCSGISGARTTGAG